jgi:hypothetical protein
MSLLGRNPYSSLESSSKGELDVGGFLYPKIFPLPPSPLHPVSHRHKSSRDHIEKQGVRI